VGVSSTILRTQERREFEKKSRFGSARTYDKQQDCEGNHRGRDIDLLRGLLADPALGLANPLVHGCLEKRMQLRGEESGRCGPAVAV
jgi:hypothetical protein